MESERNGASSSSSSERRKTSPDVGNLPEVSHLEKLSAYLFNQPFAQNWFFNKPGDEESRNSNDSLEEQTSEQNSSESQVKLIRKCLVFLNFLWFAASSTFSKKILLQMNLF